MPGSPSLELLIARSKISAFTNFATPSVFSQIFCHILPVLDILTYAIDARVYGRNRLGGCVNELILNLVIEGFRSHIWSLNPENPILKSNAKQLQYKRHKDSFLWIVIRLLVVEWTQKYQTSNNEHPKKVQTLNVAQTKLGQSYV